MDGQNVTPEPAKPPAASGPGDGSLTQLEESLANPEHTLASPEQLVQAFYPELKRLAAAKMRKSPSDHTWQPTVLVNELYLELRKIRNLRPVHAENEQERNAFFALAGQVMRWLLIRHTRPLAWQANHAELPLTLAANQAGASGVAEIEDLLGKLAAVDPLLRTVVELRAFEGQSMEEIAAKLQCSTKTVSRLWNFSKVWLRNHLGAPTPAVEK